MNDAIEEPLTCDFVDEDASCGRAAEDRATAAAWPIQTASGQLLIALFCRKFLEVMMNMTDENAQDAVRENVDRTVGISVLRHLSKVAEEEAALEKMKRVWARRLIAIVGVMAVVIVVLAVASPDTLRGLFRSVAGVIR